MAQRFLPTISEIVAAEQDHDRTQIVTNNNSSASHINTNQAQQQWIAAIAAWHDLLRAKLTPSQNNNTTHGNDTQPTAPSVDSHFPMGVVLSGPTPVLSDPVLSTFLATCTFTNTDASHSWPAALLPVSQQAQDTVEEYSQSISLFSEDSLAKEQFCLVRTAEFSLVMVLGENADGELTFQFSFDPQAVKQAWQNLRLRLLVSGYSQRLQQFDRWHERFPPRSPHYKTVSAFTHHLLQHLSDMAAASPRQSSNPTAEISSNASTGSAFHRHHTPAAERHTETSDRHASPENTNPPADVELLQAIAHEVKTPLATIRTLTRLLMKRKDLAPEIFKRLQSIDLECTEQIDRMDLIFHAVELERSTTKPPSPQPYQATSLESVLESCIPRWQKQLKRRNLKLDVLSPPKTPPVVSDPQMLERVLTGIIENFTSTLPSGSHIQVQVMLAGSQLKLQLNTSCQPPANNDQESNLKSLGQLLMFQPETGNLSLNLSATKNLIQNIGGKLIVRHRSREGQVLTIFLPSKMTTEASTHQQQYLRGGMETHK